MASTAPVVSDEGDLPFGDIIMTNTSVIEHEETTDVIVSANTAFYFKVIVQICLGGCCSLFGMCTNILNIIVFVRQGIFSDSSSATLLGLAMSDLCCVSTLLWTVLSFSLVLADPPHLSFDPWDIHYITGAWPHFMFSQTTRMITAYIAFERCICVVFPFKVKILFTPQRSMLAVVTLVAFCVLNYLPVFIAEQLNWVKDPATNTTRLVLLSTSNWMFVVDIVYYINSGSNISSVGIVFICTLITASRVKLSKSWRKSLVTEPSSKQDLSQVLPSETSGHKSNLKVCSKKEGDSQPKQMSTSKMQKEKRLVRMIISISIVFLICYVPDMTYLVVNAIDADIRILGKYDNLAQVMYAFIFLMVSINSSINIFIYYRMSSKYREEFRLMLGLNDNGSDDSAR